MPNYFYNTMTIAKSDAEKYVLGKDEDGKDGVDFNKLIPVPDSIRNTTAGSTNNPDIYWFLSNKGKKSIDEVLKDPNIAAIDTRFRGDIKEVLEQAKRTCENKSMSKHYGQDSNYRMGQILVNNYLKYGVINWYDWALKYWGTKWNAWDTEIIDYDETTYQIFFITAWDAPTAWLTKLATLCDFYLSGRDEFSDAEFDVEFTAINGGLN